MKNYLGGYYLIRLRPLRYGSQINNLVYTCSACINDNLIDTWSYSWTTNNNAQIEAIKADYLISANTVSEIRHWVDELYNEKKIGWPDIFADLENAKSYMQKFFSHLSDLKLFAIYFSENETESLIEGFKPKEKKKEKLGFVKCSPTK